MVSISNSITTTVFVSLIPVIFILFTGCKGGDASDSVITYWSSNNPEEIKFVETYSNSWNARAQEDDQLKSVHFQPIPEGQSSEEVILAAVVGKTTPDIYANMWQGEVEDYARAGVLVPLDTLDGFMEFMLERCGKAVLDEVRSSDGHIYQIPWKVNPIIMLANKDMFRSAGVDSIPQTYSGFLTAGGEISRDRNDDGHFDVWLGSTEVSAIWWQRLFNFVPLYYAASSGGNIIENEKAAFNNEYGIEVFRFLQEVYSKGYFPREQMKGQSDPFLAERIAVRFTGPWAIQQIETFMRDAFEYEFYQLPVPDDHEGPVFTYCDPKNIVMFSSCSDPDGAWKFLKSMLTDSADATLLAISNQLPRRKDLRSNPVFQDYFKSRPQMHAFAKQSEYLVGINSNPYMKEVLDLISQEYEACVVYGRKTPEKAIADAAAAIDLLYSK